jgi:succinate dehydrogenase / fumarate reductase, cytochrome b subunit
MAAGKSGAGNGQAGGAMKARPLSPHLTVYKLIPTMVMSILHRVTGAALYAGTVLLAFWLITAASGPDAFAWASFAFDSWIGRFVLFGYTWALLHHMLGGIRHFIWDAGIGFDKRSATNLAIATAVGSVSLTALLWLAVAFVF